MLPLLNSRYRSLTAEPHSTQIGIEDPRECTRQNTTVQWPRGYGWLACDEALVLRLVWVCRGHARDWSDGDDVRVRWPGARAACVLHRVAGQAPPLHVRTCATDDPDSLAPYSPVRGQHVNRH